MTHEAIRQRIRAKKEERFRNNGHLRKVLRSISGFLKPSQIYTIQDIEVFIEEAGGKFTSAGMAMTYAVRGGYVNRVGKGQYTATGKPIADL
jgi:hypothetical protein